MSNVITCQTACDVKDSKLYLKFQTCELSDSISAMYSDLRELIL